MTRVVTNWGIQFRNPSGVSRRSFIYCDIPQDARLGALGIRVICDGIAFEMPVIPAKAGMQSVATVSVMVCGMDSRFRGNDFDV